MSERESQFPGVGFKGIENSPENLRQKLFAVHATNTLPQGDRLVAGTHSIHGKLAAFLESAPSFRPTLHFALGGLMRHHYAHNHESSLYAVVTPVGEIEGQLINLFAHDTITLGDVPLSEEMTLLVQPGTDMSGITADCAVREYEGSLRNAVDVLIAEKEGWSLQMFEMSGHLGSVALLNEVNVNTPEFFAPLTAESPHIAVGAAVEASNGDAFRFGMVDQIVILVGKNYAQSRYSTMSTPTLQFISAYLQHNAVKMDEYVTRVGFDEAITKKYQLRRQELDGWITLLNHDIWLRHESRGKMLTPHSDDELATIIPLRSDPEALQQWSTKNLDSYQTLQEEETNFELLAFITGSMSTAEMAEFVEKFPQTREVVHLPKMQYRRALRRWPIIGTEQARKEGLDVALSLVLDALKDDSELSGRDIVDQVLGYLNEHNAHLPAALEALNEPAVRARLEQKGYTAPKEGYATVYDVLAGNPRYREFLHPLQLTAEEQKAQEILTKFGMGYETYRQKFLERTHDVRLVDRLIGEMLAAQSLHKRYSKDMQVPLKKIDHKGKSLNTGDVMNFAQYVHRTYPSVAKFWEQFGLNEAYEAHFKKDKQFWKSRRSIIEIRDMLEAYPHGPMQSWWKRLSTR